MHELKFCVLMFLFLLSDQTKRVQDCSWLLINIEGSSVLFCKTVLEAKFTFRIEFNNNSKELRLGTLVFCKTRR